MQSDLLNRALEKIHNMHDDDLENFVNNKDKFTTMMEIQKDFTEKVIDQKFQKTIADLSLQELQSFLKDLFIHITVECTEVLNEISWKMHKKSNYKMIDRQKLIEELVDVDKFHKNFLVVLQVSEEEFYNAWIEKSKKVEIKFNEES